MCENRSETQVDVFNYLSVVTSIILALGLGNLLVGCAQLINARDTMNYSLFFLGWVILLLPVYVVYWWAFWDYRDDVSWTFLSFFILLIGPIGLYLITAILLPDKISQTTFNATTHYLKIRSWFFGLWIVLQVWGIILSPWLRDGFRIESFINHYKFAQYFLLLMLVLGFISETPSTPPFRADWGILIAFWLVLIYLVGAHRWIIRTR